MKELARRPRKEGMRTYSAQLPALRGENSQERVGCLRGFQSEEGGELIWDAKQGDGGHSLSRSAGIASQSLCPAQAIMSTLRAGKRLRRTGRFGSRGLRKRHLHSLAAQELHASPSMLASRPISPQQWGLTRAERMEQDAHLARLFGLLAVPLTLFTLRAGAAISNSGRIDDAQTAPRFPTPLDI